MLIKMSTGMMILNLSVFNLNHACASPNGGAIQRAQTETGLKDVPGILGSYQSTISTLKAKVTSLEERIAELTQKIEILEIENQELKVQNTKLALELKETKFQLEERTKQLAELKVQTDFLISENKRLAAEYATLNFSCIEKQKNSDAIIKELNNKIDNQAEQIANYENEGGDKNVKSYTRNPLSCNNEDSVRTYMEGYARWYQGTEDLMNKIFLARGAEEEDYQGCEKRASPKQ